MKKLLLGISVVALMLTTSCGNNAEQERIAQLEKELAQLKGEKYNESPATATSSSMSKEYNDNSTSMEIDESNDQSSLSLSNEASGSRFTGTYQFTDKAGKVWIVNIKDDETATMNIKGNSYMYYAEWDDSPYGVPLLQFGWDDSPYALFPSGKEGMSYACIDDGYIYCSNTAFSAKNPRKRLPIKKIK